RAATIVREKDEVIAALNEGHAATLADAQREAAEQKKDLEDEINAFKANLEVTLARAKKAEERATALDASLTGTQKALEASKKDLAETRAHLADAEKRGAELDTDLGVT